MKNMIFPIATLAIMSISLAQVGIGTTDPDSSALLDVKSTTLGFLPPRVALAEDLVDPAEGLVVYDLTDDCLNVFDGNEWQDLCDTAIGGGAESAGSGKSVNFEYASTVQFTQVVTPPSDANNDSQTTIGVGKNGFLYGWGDDENGLIQNFDPTASETTSITAGLDELLPSPWKLSDPRFDGQIKKVDTYNGMYAVLTNNGELYCFGKNDKEYVSLNTNVAHVYIKPRVKPVPVVGQTILDIGVNQSRMIIITNDGKAYFWGQDYDRDNQDEWIEIPMSDDAQAGVTYTALMAENSVVTFLKGSDNAIYATSRRKTESYLVGSGLSSTADQDLSSPSGIHKLNFPSGAGEIVKIDVSGRTAVAFDDLGNAYGWGHYGRMTTSTSTIEQSKNFIYNSSMTPIFQRVNRAVYIEDPVLLALPAGESSFVSFSKDFTSSSYGTFLVGASGKTYFIGEAEFSDISKNHQLSAPRDQVNLNYAISISAAHVDVAQVYHEQSYVGLLDKNGTWFFFGDRAIAHIGGFQTTDAIDANNDGDADQATPIALPLLSGSVDFRNLRN